MTVVLAAVPARRPLLDVVDDEMLEALGVQGVQHLDHLMDGRPVYIPALFAGPWPVEDRRRSPRVRFVVGEIRRHPLTSRWCGPVLIDTAAGVAAYIELAYLAHQYCATCAGVWSDRSTEASATGRDDELFRTGLMPGPSGSLEILTHTRDLAPRTGLPPSGAPRRGEQRVLVTRPAVTRLATPV